MGTKRLSKLILTGAAALTIGGLAPSAASAACADADLRPTRSTHADWIVAMFQDINTAERAANAVICLTNEQRAAHNVQPRERQQLPVHSALRTAAFRQSSYMAMHNDFTHARPAPDWERARQAGYPVSYDSIGENIRWGTGALSTPRSAVNWWMGSSGHRANILNPRFHHIGVGVALSAPTTYTGQAATYTQMFGFPS